MSPSDSRNRRCSSNTRVRKSWFEAASSSAVGTLSKLGIAPRFGIPEEKSNCSPPAFFHARTAAR